MTNRSLLRLFILLGLLIGYLAIEYFAPEGGYPDMDACYSTPCRAYP